MWNRLDKSGKKSENHTKYWKIQGISDKYCLLFLVIFNLAVYNLLKWLKFSVKKKTKHKILENGKKKYTGKVREFC